MTRIDLHAHAIPDACRELLAAPAWSRPFVPAAPWDELLATMERHEIDAAAISAGPPGSHLGDQSQADELARAANESIAAIVRSTPDRYAGLDLMPPSNVESAIAELALPGAEAHAEIDSRNAAAVVPRLARTPA